jgi:hypothetical protein
MAERPSESARAPRAFLSYTYRDLSEHAAAVKEAVLKLGWECVRMEDFGAADQTPLAVGQRAIAECDAFIVMVAFMYGRVPTVDEGGDGERSWTWLEVLEAERREKPVLAFLIDDEAPVPRRLVDTINMERLAQFKAYLRDNRLVASFTTPTDVAAKVSIALAHLQLQLTDSAPPVQPPGTGPPGDTAMRPVVPAEERIAVRDDELLGLAWRLVVDFKAEPDMLLHLDATRWREAIRKLESEISADKSSPWPKRMATLRQHLEQQQRGLEPNALWLAWMRNVHALKVDTLRSMPSDRVQPGELRESVGSVVRSDAPPPNEPVRPSKTAAPVDAKRPWILSSSAVR